MSVRRGLGAVGLVVAAILVGVLVGSDDSAWFGGGTSSTSIAQGATLRGPTVPTDAAVFDSAESKAGAKSVQTMYEGVADVVALNIEPLAKGGNLRDAIDGVQDVDGLTQICDQLSEQAQEDSVSYARDLLRWKDFDWTCEKATALMLHIAKRNKSLERTVRTKVVGVNIAGDSGTATLSHGKGAPLTTVPIVKEGDDWKIGAAPGARK